jgi:hypothetical protein
MPPESPPPYWVLISVLFSSLSLTPSLAMSLHQAAYDLHAKDESWGQVIGDLANGKVQNLHKVMAMGAISGPAFEAEVETERGKGKVRFLLTREGLELMAERQGSGRKPSKPAYLN